MFRSSEACKMQHNWRYSILKGKCGMHWMFSFPSFKASLNLFHWRNRLTMCKCVILPSDKVGQGWEQGWKRGLVVRGLLWATEFPLNPEFAERIKWLQLFTDSVFLYPLLLNMYVLGRGGICFNFFPNWESWGFKMKLGNNYNQIFSLKIVSVFAGIKCSGLEIVFLPK